MMNLWDQCWQSMKALIHRNISSTYRLIEKSWELDYQQGLKAIVELKLQMALDSLLYNDAYE